LNVRLLLIALVALIIIASIGAIVVPYEKAQIDQTNATATASTHATTVASDATGTVVTHNARVTATAQAITQATAAAIAANADPYPPNQGTLVALNTTPDVAMIAVCTLQNNVLHATLSEPNTIDTCWGGPSYDNFAYDIEVTIVRGDCGGIVFREDSTEGYKDYTFDICQDGRYSIDIDQGAALTYNNIKAGTTTPGLHKGLNQANLVAVVAQGQNFSLYVNKQLVTTFRDTTYGSGRIGVAVWDDTNATDVSFANQRVWRL
jgi:hypothetical protein